VKHSNFDLMQCIYFSQFVFNEFIAKGGENVHKVVTPSFKAKLNAYSMCAQESSLYIYHTENGYRIYIPYRK
jgi:hypothetical protein